MNWAAGVVLAWRVMGVGGSGGLGWWWVGWMGVDIQTGLQSSISPGP